MKDGEGWLWILGIVAAIILVVSLGFYSQQARDCDQKHGVLVRSGISNVCVEEGEH